MVCFGLDNTSNSEIKSIFRPIKSKFFKQDTTTLLKMALQLQGHQAKSGKNKKCLY